MGVVRRHLLWVSAEVRLEGGDASVNAVGEVVLDQVEAARSSQTVCSCHKKCIKAGDLPNDALARHVVVPTPSSDACCVLGKLGWGCEDSVVLRYTETVVARLAVEEEASHLFARPFDVVVEIGQVWKFLLDEGVNLGQDVLCSERIHRCCWLMVDGTSSVARCWGAVVVAASLGVTAQAGLRGKGKTISLAGVDVWARLMELPCGSCGSLNLGGEGSRWVCPLGRTKNHPAVDFGTLCLLCTMCSLNSVLGTSVPTSTSLQLLDSQHRPAVRKGVGVIIGVHLVVVTRLMPFRKFLAAKNKRPGSGRLLSCLSVPSGCY